VCYRAFARDHAVRRGLSGGVRNLEDGRVEVDVEGDSQAVEAFIELLRAGPPSARVENLEVRRESPASRYVGFHIWY
jgi:acylphosphatase